MADNVGQIETIDCRTSSTAAGGSCMHAAADGQDDRVWIVRYQAMLHRLLTRNARYIAYRDTKRCIGTFAFVVYFSLFAMHLATHATHSSDIHKCAWHILQYAYMHACCHTLFTIYFAMYFGMIKCG